MTIPPPAMVLCGVVSTSPTTLSRAIVCGDDKIEIGGNGGRIANEWRETIL
jgi:hypothetical protein